MTISYTNEIRANVLDPLKVLMQAEFKPMDVVFENSFNGSFMRRGQYIRFWFTGSDYESGSTDGETRNYNVDIVYYFDTKTHTIETAWDKIYSDEAEHLKRLLENYTHYDDGTYRWHSLTMNMGMPISVSELENIENEDTMAVKFEVTITRNNFR